MGFSPTGSLIALALLAPNLLLVIFPPLRGTLPPSDFGLTFAVLERAGQAACVAVVTFSKASFDGRPIGPWFFLMVVCIAAYYGLWARYLGGGRDATAVYRPIGAIPIPMALIPVLAFAFAALWGGSRWLLLATVVLAIGHWTTTWRGYRALTRRERQPGRPRPTP